MKLGKRTLFTICLAMTLGSNAFARPWLPPPIKEPYPPIFLTQAVTLVQQVSWFIR
jgi:hypothetical protein